jgi:hypothetical protein
MDDYFGLHPKEKDKSTFIPDFPTENMTLSDVAQTIRSSNDMNQEQLEDMLRRNYHIFLDEKYLVEYNYRKSVIDTFSNESFILTLAKVLSTELLTDKQITCCNKVTWDYMSQDKIDMKPEIKNALMKLSGTVNRRIVTILTGYVPAQIAQLLALARYSSFKEEKNIDRANSVIVKYLKGTNVQQVVNIYGVLFRNTKLSIVFNCIMHDTDTSNFSIEERERYGIISTAILEILEQGMSKQDISTILGYYIDNYLFEKRIIKKNVNVRFSLWSINPTDYPRINSVLQSMKDKKSIP